MPVSSLNISQHDPHCTRFQSLLTLLFIALTGWMHPTFAGLSLPEQNTALAIIQAYAQDNTNSAPTLADYTALGISCVVEDNLAVVNTAIDKLARTGINSTQDVQIVVDDLLEATIDNVIAQLGMVAYAEDNTNPAPTEADYQAIGVTGITPQNVAIINETLSQLGGDNVDTTLKVQALVDHLTAPALVLQVRGLLQGAYQPDTEWMDDTLRTLNLIPTQQPYSRPPFNYNGTETLASKLLDTTEHNAIVDWVLLELRDQHTPATRISAQAALLQRDGDVVDPITSLTALRFPNLPAGNYFVTLRHRNHLPVMTQTAIALSENLTRVDFTSAATPLYGELPSLKNGNLMLLWAGDVNADDSIIANGPVNDTGAMLSAVLISEKNSEFNTNYQHSGYNPTDLNLDGLTRFTGPGNDTNLLVGNTLLYPSNTSYSANYIIHGNLP